MKSKTNLRDDIPSRFITKIECGDWKRRLLWWAFRRWVLNEDYYAVTTRFTGPRPRGSNQVSTTKANATALRIYLDRRPIVGRLEALQRDRLRVKHHRDTIAAQEHMRSLRAVS
jgi:hypothetical protein